VQEQEVLVQVVVKHYYVFVCQHGMLHGYCLWLQQHLSYDIDTHSKVQQEEECNQREALRVEQEQGAGVDATYVEPHDAQ